MRVVESFRGLSTFAGLASLAVLAPAQYVSGFTSGSLTSNPSDVQNFDNETFPAYDTPTSRSVDVVVGPDQEASGTVTGQMGSLATQSFSKFPLTGDNQYATDHSQANALDYLTVVDPLLANGTLVTLNFLDHLTGSFSVPALANGGGYQVSAAASFSANGQEGSFNDAFNNGAGLAPSDLTGTIQAKVGERLSLGYTLDTLVYVNGEVTVSRQASANLSATIFAWSTTPSVTLVSASGYDYAPAPEPGTLAALGLGALAVCRRAKSLR